MTTTSSFANIKIAIADDQSLVRESISKALIQQGFTIIGEAENGSALLNLLAKQHADIVLLDLEMPHQDGWATLPKLQQKFQQSKVIILTQHVFNSAFTQLYDDGAACILGKNLNLTTLTHAILTVYEKGFCLGPDFNKFITRHSNDQSTNNSAATNSFNELEKKVLTLICNDLLTKDIAVELGVTTRTAERYVSALYGKTKAKSPAGLLTFAVRNKFFNF